MSIPYLLWSLCGFVSGGILYSYYLPLLLKGVDICDVSLDHNPGVTNAMRYAGVPIGIGCVLLDLAKGFFPIVLARHALGTGDPLFAVIMAAPVLGHALAPFNRRIPGGKAITTSFGVLLGLLPESNIVFLLAGLYIVYAAVVRIHPNERCTVITFATFSATGGILLLWSASLPIVLGCFAISFVVIFRNLSDAFPKLNI